MTHRKKLAAAGGAVALAAIAVAVAIASPATDLTGVPSANTNRRATRRPRCSRRNSRRSLVAQGSTKVENPSAAISYYGYDNDMLNSAGQPVMVPRPRPATEAHKTEPDKNTYLVFDRACTGADPTYDYGKSFLFQGHETGSAGLHHPDQPRRRRRPPRDGARDSGRRTATRSRTSTARPGIHSRSGCCSRPRTRARRPTRPRPATPPT